MLPMRPRVRREEDLQNSEEHARSWRWKHYEQVGSLAAAAVTVILIGSCQVRKLRAETEDTFDSKVRDVIAQVDVRKKSADAIVDKLGLGFEDAKGVCKPILDLADAFKDSGLLPNKPKDGSESVLTTSTLPSVSVVPIEPQR